MRYGVVIALFLMASACTGPNPDTMDGAISPISVAQGDHCRAAQYEDLTGQKDTVLERIYILRQVRILRPNQPVTKDLRPERLNFEIGPEGRITRVFCG